MRLTNEQELLTLLKNGDEKAFVELYNAYSPVLFSFLTKFNFGKDDTRDVIQQTFIKLWENREGLKEGLSLQSYLITIAKNDISNIIRKQIIAQKYRSSISADAGIQHPSMETELASLLEQIKKLLPGKRGQVFFLSRVEGYSNSEIAEQMKITRSTVENHINQSNKQVKSLLRKLGISD